ncbi:G-protein coupled receptor 183-A [Octopus bimaculoides]|uniref:G-protein coupled receptors family 1 profile domain-containing protein n=1 Tax=Octopus bimaculoides TaxID=37653 RepID=A0A0L8I9P9_OCTBM|nr:G-protein coupled receptor 183-A [Octopus bimaculoides]XP_052829259.1 G-protein coupled receptor 183-A [Octopus bimaculoides]|eukprot:XP_014783881.1 PREDICTED: G-protein coupled receptor 183-A-like [Octopus bimaculoides]
MNDNETFPENITSVFERHSWPMGLFKEFCPSALYIDRYVNAVWHIIGLFTNPISAFIWLNHRIRRNNSSAIYLAALSITDFMFLWLHFINELQIAWGISTVAHAGICELYNFIYMIPQYLAPIIVLGFTVERWIAVCKPFHKERFCTVKRAIYVVCGLIFLSSSLASAQIYIWNYDETHKVCTYRDTNVTPYSFTEVWNWLSEMSIFGGVPICVLIFNILVICEIRKITKANAIQLPHQTSSGSNNAASTITLLSVSFYLIFTTLPVALVFVIATNFEHGNGFMTDDEIRADPQWNRFFTFMITRRCIEGICFSHYSCYFFVYCLTGPQFRKTFMTFFPNKIFQALNNSSQGRYTIVTGNGRANNESCTTYV